MNGGGTIAQLDSDSKITASWSFAKLMSHWKRKHSQAVYIPCSRRKNGTGEHEYNYGNDIELGVGTDFELILSSMVSGDVYYEPGIKLEDASSQNSKPKRRSQFRVNHKHLNSLYRNFEFVDIMTSAEYLG
jgi:hypothetical protein